MAESSGNGGKLCIGLMSGTSVDAIDAALVRIERDGEAVSAELLAFREVSIEPEVRSEVFALFEQ
ncbi:MAG TPA: anhydro-N-acetylmuramic acid kinase, partial [Thermomicrobiaceae bacterium]|nr:anhydro-N-acetylmuramic acid kinase [Thermomicrobiaceae bacterium]